VSIIITPESQLGIELAKWNVKRPPTYFPQMLYMAQKRPDGVMSVGETSDGVFGGNPGAAEQFNTRCQRTVETEAERALWIERGWRPTPREALERLEAKDKSIADAAAHRAFEDRNMSDAAKAEVAAVEAESEAHVAEVPEKRRPGRPRKIA
jgi:hypothetical protein